MDAPFSEAFVAVMDYVEAKGPVPVNTVEGCWEADIDGRFSIALNGHQQPVQSSRGLEVQPFHCAVFWRGWPLGFLSPYGGEMLVDENANEDLFIEAVEAATKLKADLER